MDLRMGNDAKVATIAIVEVTLQLLVRALLALDACYFVPLIIKNIIYISCLINYGYRAIFENNDCSLIQDDEIIGRGTLSNDLFILDDAPYIINVNVSKRKRDKVNNAYLWHYTLDHIHEGRI